MKTLGGSMKQAIKASIGILILLPATAAWSFTGVSWAQLPAGAREAGLAGGMSSMADGLQGSRLAPSSLASMQGMQADASHTQWLQGVTQDQAAFAMGVGHSLGVALDLDWLDMGEVEQITVAGQSNGSIHPTAGAVTLSLGGAVNSNLDAGVAFRGWRQDLDNENALAGSGSASLAYKLMPSISVVGALVDLGSTLDGDDLPTTLRFGGSWHSKGGDRIAFEGAAPIGFKDGVDWSTSLVMPVASVFVVRGGLLLTAGALQPTPTIGMSVLVSTWSFDVGYRPSDALGSTLNIGLSWAAL
jgi:hypothetical protein